MYRLCTAVMFWVTALACAAQPLVLGVQTHFAFEPARTNAQAYRSWMERARFNSSRDEMFWWHVEDSAGSLALRQGALRSQQQWASMPGPFAGLLTVGFGHPRHDAGAQPKTDAGRLAFARYASFVASQGKPHVRWVEVWNEWNMPTPAEREAGSRGDAQDYALLARAAYRRLKAEHPGIAVLTGSAGDDARGWNWTRQAIGHGMLAHTDGVAAHLYNHCSRGDLLGSDDLAERLDALHGIVSAAGHPRMPIYVTEVGWPTHQGPCGMAELAAAAHSLRFLLEASLRPWVAGVWFYEMQDGGDDPHNQEHRFGLLRRDGTEKPAGCALRELGAQIAGRPVAFHRGKATGAAVFRNGSTDRWLLWARGRSQRTVQVRLESAANRTAAYSVAALCGLPAADLRVEPRGRYATLHLAPQGVHAIEVPAGEPLRMEELP
ncbi:MAG TPA: hypothetical protein VLI46_15190 [Ramlibacter sp.]|nr:hypothetical protein [Ramlibacter sp.]